MENSDLNKKKKSLWIWSIIPTIVCIIILSIIIIAVNPKECKERNNYSDYSEQEEIYLENHYKGNYDSYVDSLYKLYKGYNSGTISEDFKNKDNDEEDDKDESESSSSSYRPPSSYKPSSSGSPFSNSRSSSSSESSSYDDDYKDLDDLDEDNDHLYYFHHEGDNEVEDTYYDDNNMYENFDYDE